jgi:hypothetical protein
MSFSEHVKFSRIGLTSTAIGSPFRAVSARRAQLVAGAVATADHGDV